jgi:hypothetical protein
VLTEFDRSNVYKLALKKSQLITDVKAAFRLFAADGTVPLEIAMNQEYGLMFKTEQETFYLDMNPFNG